MSGSAGRSTAHARRLWGYCHAQIVWFGIKESQYLARCWSFKALLDGAQSMKDMAAEGRHGTIAGIFLKRLLCVGHNTITQCFIISALALGVQFKAVGHLNDSRRLLKYLSLYVPAEINSQAQAKCQMLQVIGKKNVGEHGIECAPYPLFLLCK